MRRGTEEAAAGLGFAQTRTSDLVTAVSEAGMNAAVHGGGGQRRVCAGESTVQVWVQDSGRGIEGDRLRRAGARLHDGGNTRPRQEDDAGHG